MVEPLHSDRRYGARVALLDHETILVQQTSREHPVTGNNPHALDHVPGTDKVISRHVHWANVEELSRAVRDALYGRLDR